MTLDIADPTAGVPEPEPGEGTSEDGLDAIAGGTLSGLSGVAYLVVDTAINQSP